MELMEQQRQGMGRVSAVKWLDLDLHGAYVGGKLNWGILSRCSGHLQESELFFVENESFLKRKVMRMFSATQIFVFQENGSHLASVGSWLSINL